ncbi:hypothetical protein IE331_11420 [Nocardioides sp. MJB4]|uniref:SRPBCC family protein n=1 Tax=Nocardioides donggukensis TaxID=2774019 RepID=A0A927K746_9ACTN|nr:hypothetical protein [Nocardioides donggukensis]
MLGSVAPRPGEVAAALPGDELVPDPDVVMDRGFDLAVPPAVAWPWLVQLGKGRAGWYLPRRVERLLPRARRATRTVEARWQSLAVGDVIPDYGGPEATFEVADLEPGAHLVHRSERGRTQVSWAIVLRPQDAGTRVHLRLRLGPVRHVRLARSVGGLFDALTLAGLAAGLRERV